MHTQMHTGTGTGTHRRTRTDMRTQTCTHRHAHRHTHRDMHAQEHKHAHSHAQAHAETYVLAGSFLFSWEAPTPSGSLCLPPPAESGASWASLYHSPGHPAWSVFTPRTLRLEARTLGSTMHPAQSPVFGWARGHWMSSGSDSGPSHAPAPCVGRGSEGMDCCMLDFVIGPGSHLEMVKRDRPGMGLREVLWVTPCGGGAWGEAGWGMGGSRRWSGRRHPNPGMVSLSQRCIKNGSGCLGSHIPSIFQGALPERTPERWFCTWPGPWRAWKWSAWTGARREPGSLNTVPLLWLGATGPAWNSQSRQDLP